MMYCSLTSKSATHSFEHKFDRADDARPDDLGTDHGELIVRSPSAEQHWRVAWERY